MQTRPELVGDFGMVASTHWLASAAGMSVLERGGNAADAAVAAGFVLQVVEPHLNGPGGEVPILICEPREGNAVSVVDGQGPVPRRATTAVFAELGLDLVPGTGLLAATVPGAFGAWTLLLERFGTWPLADVLAYAIGLAADGWPLLPTTAATIAGVAEQFTAHWPQSARTWLADGVPRAGQRMRNPVLADTYRRVLAEAQAASGDRDRQIAAARDAWYRGFVAEAIGSFCAGTEVMDASGRTHRGLLTGDDLAAWRPGIEPPVTVDYQDCQVFKTGPWGQGPVLCQQLRLLAGYDLTAMGVRSADFVHTVVECAKLAFADREAWYGDPHHIEVPLADLLDAGYAAERRQLVGDGASYELRPGRPGGRVPTLPSLAESAAGGPTVVAGVGEPTIARDGQTRGDTCHLDVVDRQGRLVSATPSGGWLQSSPTIPELGFCLGTRAQMCWLQDGLPSTLRPGARPRTTLSPSLAFRDGRPWLAFGTPGGDQQDQWSLHFLLTLLHSAERDVDLQAAIDAPMWHSAHFPSSFYPRRAEPGRLVVEDRLAAETVAGLRSRGHDVQLSGAWSLGRLSAVAVGPDGFFRAAANPRGAQGYATGR